MDRPTLLRTKEVAQRLGVTSVTVTRWINRGHFPNAYKLGPYSKSPFVIPETDVISFEEKYRTAKGRQDLPHPTGPTETVCPLTDIHTAPE